MHEDFILVEIFYLVFSQLAVGGLAVLLLIPKGLVGANFYRLMGGIYLLVGGLARCANLYLNEQPITFLNFFGAGPNYESIFVLSFIFAIIAYTISLWFKYHIVTQIFFYFGVMSGVVGIVVSALSYLPIVQFPWAQFLLPLQFLVSAILLGAVHTGMWFGHWYLVTPELPVHYLRRYNTLLLSSLVAMVVLFCMSMIFRLQIQDPTPFSFHYELVFWIRLGVGFATTLLVYFISWDCLRPKSVAKDEVGATRAATGFLFIAIITVFLGEFCGRYLFLALHFIF